MTKRIWALALFCSFLQVTAQTHAQFRAYADASFANGDWEVALLNYNRLLFSATAPEEQAVLNYNIASCYYLMGSYALAANYFDFAFFSATSDSMQTEAVLAKSRTLMREESWVLAIFELANLAPESPDFDATIALYTGLCYFHQNKFDAAIPYFKTVLATDSNAQLEMERLLTARKWLYRPNPNLARWLSIVPGTGQFYAGDVKNGLNSLLLNTGLFALGINVVQNLAVADAVLSVMPWVQRYYMGGMEAAERIAVAKRKENRQMALGQVLDLIQAHQTLAN